MRFRAAFVLAVTIGALLAPVAPAQVQTRERSIDRAVEALRGGDPVFVHPDAEAPIDEARVEERIRRGDAGTVFVAVLPESAGRATAVARQIAQDLGRPGVYAVIAGRSFAGGSTTGPPVRDLATEAVEAKRSEGATAIVLDFIDRVADRRAGSEGGSSGAGSGSDGGGDGVSGGLVLALLGLGGVAAAVVVRRRRRREEQRQLDEVKTVARDDLVALGDDIRALDLDVEMPDADPEAKRYYGQAVEAYSRAQNGFDLARRPQALEQVTRDLEEGRYAMTAAKACLEGRPVPERTLPCFFDPRHGPSTEMVEWAPPGGRPRPVPVCAADAVRLKDGLDPQAREIDVDGERTPYWNAPGYYAPYAGGFFGGYGGFFPGLFLGSVLGGGFGGHDSYVEHDHGGDWGGGDFGGGGDVGGGGDGGDFGGGDF